MEQHAHRRLLTLHGASRASTAQDGRQAAKSSAHLPQLSQPQLHRHAATEPRAASLQGHQASSKGRSNCTSAVIEVERIPLLPSH